MFLLLKKDVSTILEMSEGVLNKHADNVSSGSGVRGIPIELSLALRVRAVNKVEDH